MGDQLIEKELVERTIYWPQDRVIRQGPPVEGRCIALLLIEGNPCSSETIESSALNGPVSTFLELSRYMPPVACGLSINVD